MEFYTANGPIFVYVDDGLTYTDEWIRAGLVYDIARSTGGALVTAAHRYFGNNIPTPLVYLYIKGIYSKTYHIN